MHAADRLFANDTVARAPLVALPPRAVPEQIRTGHGQTHAHHGEVMQGVFYSRDGTLEHGLVTLPCMLVGSRAHFRPARSGPLIVEPAARPLARRAARITLDTFGRAEWGGSLRLESDVPVRWGCGSSTADVLATVRAVADAFDTTLRPEWIARLSVASETASDSLMFGPHHAVLFAQRRGSVLLDLGGPLPTVCVLGFNTEGDHGVETLTLPPCEYSAWEVEAFQPMLGLLCRAVEQQDPELLGRVATASTTIAQRHRPKRYMPQVLALAKEVCALGVQVAHSGTVIGLLFEPGPGSSDRIACARVGLGRLGLQSCWEFSTNVSSSLEAVS